MKILFLAFEVPYPLDRGGRIKTFHYLRALTRYHQVSLVALVRNSECMQKLGYLQSELSLDEVYGIHTDLSLFRKARLALCSWMQAKPFVMSLYHNIKGKHMIESLLDSNRFDLIYADHLHMAQYVPEGTRALTLLDQHNVESVFLRRFAETRSLKPLRWFAYMELGKMARYEPAVCRRFDSIWVTTDVDRELISPWLLPTQHIEVLPIGVDVRYFQPRRCKPDPYTLTIVGTLSWPANADGALWFYNEIYSLLKRQFPDIRLVIVGANPPQAIRRLDEDPSVTVTGWVDDVRPYLACSTAMVVPLRCGSGMRVKILDALAMGLPVVSTSVGCEGIDVTPGKDILVSDNPIAFVEQTSAVLRDQELQRILSDNGVKLIQEKYSWDSIYDRINESLATILEDGIVSDRLL